MSVKDILKKLGLTSDGKEVRRNVRRVKRPSNKGFKTSSNSLQMKRIMNEQYDAAPFKIQGRPIRHEKKDNAFYDIAICDLAFLIKKRVDSE